jgi:hypothetical protein
MKEFLKIMMRVLLSIAGMGLLGFGVLVGCFQYVGNSNSCVSFNIDNIELRTRIDIPTIEQGCNSCQFNKKNKTKTNYFKIRTDVEDMNRYVHRNNFIPVHEKDLDLSVFEKLENVKIPEITPENRKNIFYNSGERKGTDWLAIVDKNSGDLWVYMKIKGLW